MKRRAIFMTGSTGFVGSHLASRLDALREQFRLFLLARGKDTESAEDRIRKRIPHVRGTVVRGDICEGPDLGISPKDRDLLKGYDLEVWHVAGNTSFSDEDADKIFRVNLEGTRNVLAFAESLGVRRLHYVSTAYIAGDRKGLPASRQAIAYEDEDWVGQRFRNPYEESKFLAERLVKDWSKRVECQTSIYRISIAVGDSQTGAITSFTGYYAYMRGFYLLRERILQNPEQYRGQGVRRRGKVLSIPAQVRGTPHATINIACVDYLSDVMVKLAAHPKSVGKTFHVVNPEPPRFDWLLKTGLRAMQIEDIQVLGPLPSPQAAHHNGTVLTGLEKTINDLLAVHEDYTLGEPVFDASNVRAVLGEIPKHPPVDDDLIQRLLTYARTMNFGRTRGSTAHHPG